jgi:dolichol-phosphate mannosyltransferase
LESKTELVPPEGHAGRDRTKYFAKYIKFCVVGTTGLVIDSVILYFLASIGSWSLVFSKVCAAEIAMVSNFILNDNWTFRKKNKVNESAQGIFRRFIKFNFISLGGMVLSVFLLTLQVKVFAMPLIVANILAVIATSLSNFLLSVRFGWGDVGCNRKSSAPIAPPL